MYKLTVKGLAEGEEILVDGVGSLENGTYSVTDEEAQAFKDMQSYNPKPRTLLQAFSKHPNISVEKVGSTNAQSADTSNPASTPDGNQQGAPNNDEGGDK